MFNKKKLSVALALVLILVTLLSSVAFAGLSDLYARLTMLENNKSSLEYQFSILMSYGAPAEAIRSLECQLSAVNSEIAYVQSLIEEEINPSYPHWG